VFVREVVTGQGEGRPVRYAQIVASYRNAQGSPRHRVVLSLGRVDTLDPAQLRDLARALLRYAGDDASLSDGSAAEVREVGLPWAVHGAWTRLGLPEHLERLAHGHGLPSSARGEVFARVLALVACGGAADGGRAWLAHEAFGALPDGSVLCAHFDGEELLAQVGPDLERELFVRRAVPQGRVYAAVLPDVQQGWTAAVACDGNGYPVASLVARKASSLPGRLHRRLRGMGARQVCWRDDDGGFGPERAARAVATGFDHVRWGWASAGTGDMSAERSRTRLTAALLAALVRRQLERDAGQPMQAVRETLRLVRAVQVRTGGRTCWQAAVVPPPATALASRLGLDVPSALPDWDPSGP
jgi:hypothetical protein